MKVIFLDIDGVLNSEQFFQRFFKEKMYEREDVKNSIFYRNIDMNCLALLKELVHELNLGIVISSSWRFDPETKIFLDEHCGKCVVGRTDYLGSYPIRGKEIDKWLKEHSDIENYVILDDDCDMLDSQLDHFICTSRETGLTKEDIVKCRKILENDAF